ncbi:MAG: PEP/pyruvate-binding domain-containing protein [Chitinispirillaceae bacterium]|nr:PEP/pyruvate-binding domain-containing protein [Chitinispirillaceae bacterium]
MSEKKAIPVRFQALLERAKELDCLYRVEELLAGASRPLPDIFRDIIAALPSGWQYPKLCQARITYEVTVYESARYVPSAWSDTVPIKEGDLVTGSIEVSYVRAVSAPGEDCFLKKERKLLRTIADRIGQTTFHRKLELLLRERDAAEKGKALTRNHEWMAIVDLLRHTDEKLYLYISRKMLYHLFWSGIKESSQVLNSLGQELTEHSAEGTTEANSPRRKQSRASILSDSDRVFAIAARYLGDDEILSNLRKWILLNKLGFLIKTVDSGNAALGTIIDAILRFRSFDKSDGSLEQATEMRLRVSLIRRFFTDNVDFINIAKRYVEVSDFFDLVTRIIYPAGSNGRLGGKSTGLFLAAQILKKAAEKEKLLAGIKTPKTWYLTADCLADFLQYNELEDVLEIKYKDLEQVRLEYPNIIQLFKHARFPMHISRGLMQALDDFGERPIIVRSSSLLEDRVGTAFSGKYKSLFLSNKGNAQERLESLLDAIAEIYASVFGPDPIFYRSEHGLLDFHEEMGIMIQEVVGTHIGPYFLPVFAGVSFSSNEFRWSPRLKRVDGLVRLVPGLGTRAVDRIGNDYPVLFAPGQPALRVNTDPDEVRHYSPRQIDAIDLENDSFQTVTIESLVRTHGSAIPNLSNLVSVYKDGLIHHPSSIELDVTRDELVFTFNGLINKTNFVKQMRAILLALQEAMKTPVDIEFASDGASLFLLQCRAQFTESDIAPSAIPRDIPERETLFTAKRFISNGHIPDITHIVYVSPQRYAEQTSLAALVDIGRAVSKLNSLLPKRRFILMGPGRWGSRGDIKQGVQVTYSDICNTAVLIEIALKSGSYEPELSFGTHFFQDMVEAGICYIPLYPDEKNVIFNEMFLNASPNILPSLLPEYAHLSEVLHVIDVPGSKDGNIAKIQMNAELCEAIGFFSEPSAFKADPIITAKPVERHNEAFWQWRLRMAEQLALRLTPGRFGIQAMYLIGSTVNATAGPGSDIEVLIHFRGTPRQRLELSLWLEGWSLSLGEFNYLRTGYASDGLLDVHIVTDADIEARTSYAVKIGAVTDPAIPLPMGVQKTE